jgi:hypothetical protein
VGEIFLSYSRADSQWINKLVHIIQRAGFSVWFDEDILPGEQFDTVVEAAVAKASKVVVVWSNASIGSRWVRAEAGEGLDRGILVPVLKERVRIPLEFRRVQAADLSDWSGEGEHKELGKLLAALNPRGRYVGKPTSSDHKTHDAKQRRVSAEIIQADRFLSNIKIRLIVDRDVFVVEHINMIAFQVVRVNGIEVGRGGGFIKIRNYFQFYIEQDEEQLFAELRPEMSLWGGLKGIRLFLRDKEILAERISFFRGVSLFRLVILILSVLFILLVYLVGTNTQ